MGVSRVPYLVVKIQGSDPVASLTWQQQSYLSRLLRGRRGLRGCRRDPRHPRRPQGLLVPVGVAQSRALVGLDPGGSQVLRPSRTENTPNRHKYRTCKLTPFCRNQHLDRFPKDKVLIHYTSRRIIQACLVNHTYFYYTQGQQ